jgi:ferredoxin
LQNSKKQEKKEKVMSAKVNPDVCTGCEACVESCPVEAIKMAGEKAEIGDECIDCGVCVSECPVEAIKME